ncbi:trans-feruloyl-CoA synthase [Paraburkholderia sp. BL27I4N3]|uniref:feruloyl-CoA synthase n=1 Tax=Paraburkholderia sp. BL27I4N3 TaxID=1938805 RepID=UPI000E23AE3E|nr:feruloyl-CoA synthase [Paraburkholderia sp. BL27I4N3]REE07391.1 trans-feruloyl-CoA synthase [Paraburkholderia sp. BL27I4N3]
MGIATTHPERQAEGDGYRHVSIGSAPPRVSHDGETWRLQSSEVLGAYPERLTDCLERGAQKHPDRWLAAQRGVSGRWVGVTYKEMFERARAIGQALVDRKLSAERPVVVLSGNDLNHLQIALGAMWAGVPYAPVSPAYSLVSKDFGKLRHIFQVLTPGLVFAADADAFATAIENVVPDDVEVVTVSGAIQRRKTTPLGALVNAEPGTVDAVHECVDADTIAKILFTSGSTKLPKAVPTTHRMLCSNQQMLLQTFPEFATEPPVLVDWLPWNHTFGGSHNVGIALYNGGTLYIDDGKPVPGQFNETLRNLREIAPTIYFNVPKGWEELTVALEQDAKLRESFFSRVKVYFFAGAGLSQAAWDRLERVTEQYCGERIRIMAGLGMTETSPCCLFTTGPLMRAGYVGLPAPGCDTKLVPVDGKLEARFRGPHVMQGYWRMGASEAVGVFDDEGYYCSGDALRFVDEAHPEAGLMFDGRIAEDFKLSTGTFVSVGPMRARVIAAGAPYVQDVVVTGADRNAVGVMIFPRIAECRQLALLPLSASPREILGSTAVLDYFAGLLKRLNGESTGSATFIEVVRLLDTPPSLELGEATDKGSLNLNVVLLRRAEVVTSMYSGLQQDTLVIRSSNHG